MIFIPLTSSGERFVTVNTGYETLIFRTYYTYGQDAHWLLDIKDSQGELLASGINLVPGVDNLLKGRGDVLEGHQLVVITRGEAGPAPADIEEEYKGTDAPGDTLFLAWFNPNDEDENPFIPGDPMETIGENTW